MRTKPHSHPCAFCKARTECCGDVEQNYDGWPEWICREFHGENREFLCEDCEELRLASCADCLEREGEDVQATKRWTYDKTILLCEDCFKTRDNYEPPDPDGEAFRGGEAAAFQAEQMEAARRLK
jgi:hypothetical protein